jgi:hypothetical protein
MSDVYFKNGDIVRVRQEILNRPNMVIAGPEREKSSTGSVDSRGQLIGLRTFWFTDTGEFQTGVFDTKDLEKIE